MKKIESKSKIKSKKQEKLEEIRQLCDDHLRLRQYILYKLAWIVEFCQKKIDNRKTRNLHIWVKNMAYSLSLLNNAMKDAQIEQIELKLEDIEAKLEV